MSISFQEAFGINYVNIASKKLINYVNLFSFQEAMDVCCMFKVSGKVFYG